MWIPAIPVLHLWLIYIPLRSGTDIAFISGMINYILQNDLYHKEYVQAYTNASYLIADGYTFADGLFSGYDAAKRLMTIRPGIISMMRMAPPS